MQPRAWRWSNPCLTLLFLAASLQARGQSISTVAGGGSDDGRPATQASLGAPRAVAVDAAGNLFVADAREHRVRRVDATTGLVTTVAGTGTPGFSGDGGPATLARLDGPAGLALDAAGNLFVADTLNNRVRRVDVATGAVRTVAGNGAAGGGGDGGPATAASLGAPRGLALDGDGGLLVADTLNAKVRRVDPRTGTVATVAGSGVPGDSGDGGAATQARLTSPVAVAVGPGGLLLVADAGASRVRAVDAGTGTIRTVAGDGTWGFSGDDGPATAAQLMAPMGLAVDRTGGLLVADVNNGRVRRVDAGDGTITTVAGGGRWGFGEGLPARAAELLRPAALAATPDGGYVLADLGDRVVRKVQGASGEVVTVAGDRTGAYTGDGGPATRARLIEPRALAVDGTGALLVAVRARVRAVDAAAGTVTTVAGTGEAGFSGDDGPATEARLGAVVGGLAVDAEGNLYLSDTNNHRVRMVSAWDGTITTVAGSGAEGDDGDGGPAAEASLGLPAGLAVDPFGGLYVADALAHRVRRVDTATGEIWPFAGDGTPGFDGDGGPAELARLLFPAGLAVDIDGSVLVADAGNARLRRVDASTGTITTVAGTGRFERSGDGGPAASASLVPGGVAVDPSGNLLVSDPGANVVLRVDAGTGLISTVAGSGRWGFGGDGGAATQAQLDEPSGLAVDFAGSLLLADAGNGRVRRVGVCASPMPAPLLSPAPDEETGTDVPLSWERVDGAARYDVYAGTDPDALTPVATGLAASTARLPSLLPATVYSWKVVARGDPSCPDALSESEVRSFTTAARCASPPAPVVSVPDGGTGGLAGPVTVSWDAVPGAGTYDVHAGPSEPAPLVAGGVTETTAVLDGLASGTAYRVTVVARAACDASLASSSVPVRFVTAGTCAAPAAPSDASPAAGATVDGPVTLSWSASEGATGYDVSLGTAAEPPLLRPGLAATSLVVAGLAPGATYSWRVVARCACDPSWSAAGPVQSFTVAARCGTPPAPVGLRAPEQVASDRLYLLAWSAVPGIDPGGAYVVERSASPSFDPLLDVQTVSVPSASFVAGAAGTVYHRVRAVPSCDPSSAGPGSEPAAVEVVGAPAEVVVGAGSRAVSVPLGGRLEDVRDAGFTLESLGPAPVEVSLAVSEEGPVPFFRVEDPSGGDPGRLLLEPRTPRRVSLVFSGPPADVPGSYSGRVTVTGEGLVSEPSVPVTLRVGGLPADAPRFLLGGHQVERASFEGLAEDADAEAEAARRPVEVLVENPGPTPMELSFEVGPGTWLVPEPGWDATPIAPGASRLVRLRTRRLLAPAGSRLPRTATFTVRTPDGAAASLRVEDPGRPGVGTGRPPQAAPGGAARIVPAVVHAPNGSGGAYLSRLLVVNGSTEDVAALLLFVPQGEDGVTGPGVRSVSVVVPGGGTLRTSDPLSSLFGLAPPAAGSLEVRAGAAHAGALTVASSVDAVSPGRTGAYSFQMPVVQAGDGARAGRPQVVAGLCGAAVARSNLVLRETSGVDGAAVRAVLYDASGARLGDALVAVPRAGGTQLGSVVEALGGREDLTGGRLELSVESGAGAVAAVALVIDGTTSDVVALPARPAGTPVPTALRSLAPRPTWAAAASGARFVVPVVETSLPVFGAQAERTETFRSSLLLAAADGSPASFDLAYRDEAGGEVRRAHVDVATPRGALLHDDVLVQLLGVAPGSEARGTLLVEGSASGLLASSVASRLATGGAFGDAAPVIQIPSGALTGAGSATPLVVDGLEQRLAPGGTGLPEQGAGTRTSLTLTEVLGAPVTVTVRLYEEGTGSPVGQADVEVPALGTVRLDSVFSALGLGSPDRARERSGVRCVVTARSGSGMAAAVATTVDGATGDPRTVPLVPVGGGQGVP